MLTLLSAVLIIKKELMYKLEKYKSGIQQV